MIAIADVSGDLSAAWSWPVWVFLAAVALVTYVFYTALTNPIPDLDPAELDTHDPNGPGHYYVMDLSREFYQCADQTCGHRVNRHGETL